MLILTTPNIEGKSIVKYIGLVSGNAILGTNIVRDFFAGIKDIVGGRSTQYEDVLEKAMITAQTEMVEKAEALGANAILSVNFDYSAIGQTGSMLMVNATGTAVIYE